MPRRRRTFEPFPISLPIAGELLVLVGSLVVGELFVVVSVWLVLTERLDKLQDAFGITLDPTSLISKLLPVVVIIGLVVGVKIHFKVRRWLNVEILRPH